MAAASVYEGVPGHGLHNGVLRRTFEADDDVVDPVTTCAGANVAVDQHVTRGLLVGISDRDGVADLDRLGVEGLVVDNIASRSA